MRLSQPTRTVPEKTSAREKGGPRSVPASLALAGVALLATWMGRENGGYFTGGWAPVALVLSVLLIVCALVGVAQAQGAIEPEEFARTFNCGVGMAVVVGGDEVDAVTAALTAAGETVFRIGRVEAGLRGCTVRGSAGTWSARADWTARHDA